MALGGLLVACWQPGVACWQPGMACWWPLSEAEPPVPVQCLPACATAAATSNHASSLLLETAMRWLLAVVSTSISLASRPSQFMVHNGRKVIRLLWLYIFGLKRLKAVCTMGTIGVGMASNSCCLAKV